MHSLAITFLFLLGVLHAQPLASVANELADDDHLMNLIIAKVRRANVDGLTLVAGDFEWLMNMKHVASPLTLQFFS